MNDSTATTGQAVLPQQVRWGPDDGQSAGVRVWFREDQSDVVVIPWDKLMVEFTERVLPQAFARPQNYTLKTFDYHGKPTWLVRICDREGNPLYGVWFGKNPDRNWAVDGLIYIGDPKGTDEAGKISRVWQTWQRFSDGSYRLIFSRSATLDEADREPIP